VMLTQQEANPDDGPDRRYVKSGGGER
jgi:hypothetical protein